MTVIMACAKYKVYCQALINNIIHIQKSNPHLTFAARLLVLTAHREYEMHPKQMFV